MAVLASPSAEQGYIKTVLSKDHFMDLDSSSLALPSEDKLAISRQDLEKAMRIQHQVQLTMARKTTKKSLANGTIHRAVSIPDQVVHNTTLHRETLRSPTKYDSVKNYSAYENGWGGGHAQYGQRGNENGWSKSYSSYSQWGMEQDGGQRRPLVRKDMSPERQEAVMGGYEQWKNTTTSPRYAASRPVNMSTMRYSRSEYGQGTRPRQSTVKKSTHSDQDSVFINSVPTSPARPYYQQRNSHSVDNLLEKKHYQTQSAGVVGQVKPQTSNRFNTHQTNTNTKYSTYRKEYIQSPSAASGFDLTGKRAAMTVGMMAAANSGNIIEQDGEHLSNAVGSAPMAFGSQTTSEVQMTLERAVSLLQNDNTTAYWLTSAASYIQHECFQKSESRKKVYILGGIPKLIQLLSNANVDTQRAACAALRNLVYEDNDNKLEVCEQRAMPILLNMLKESRDLEIKKQITGLMWNLSSNDQLKVMLIRDALPTLTNNIIIPGSGWKDGEYSKNELMSDTDIFYNATGCLRNMSSAGPEGRKALRECDGLIDSLVYYISRSVADYKPDDRATENCVCILHNLSYQLESEVSSRYSHNFHSQNQNLTSSDSNIGCFGSRSRKLKEDWRDVPIAEETSNPRGVECLWSSKLVRLYLSLIAKSTRNYTQEASLGSLQNLTAGNGPIPYSVARTIVQKEGGLQHIRSMLFSNDLGVKRTAVSLLRNLSRNSALQNEIAKELMGDLVRSLPDRVPDSNIGIETSASICYILNNLICNSSNNAKMLLQYGGISKLVNISNSDIGMVTKTGKAASLVLYNLWYHQDLHNAYKKAQFKKTDFVNPRTSKAHNSL